MQINVSNNNINYRASIRTVYDFDKGKIKYRTNTWFFRSDLDWDGFANFVGKRFNKETNIPVINFACSDGEESFSLAYKLIENLKEKANKFFPILASDIDKENIIKAKSKSAYRLDYNESETIKKMSNDFKDYFKIYYENDYSVAIAPNNDLRKKIKFKKADIFNELDNLPKGDKIVLLRNCLPYLTQDERSEILNKLNKNMTKKSLLVLGDYDKDSLFLKPIMLEHGFVPTKIHNVYQKVPSKLLLKLMQFIYYQSTINLDFKHCKF